MPFLQILGKIENIFQGQNTLAYFAGASISRKSFKT
jgi:hypothetical protein